MAPVYNAVTGCKRKSSRWELPRKKRNSHASTVSGRMFANQAMKDYQHCMFLCQVHVVCLGILCRAQHINLQPNSDVFNFGRLLLIGAISFFVSATKLLLLDSELLDLQDDVIETGGFRKKLLDITLDSFENDDECEAKTQFTKAAILNMIGALNKPDIVYIYFHYPKYYKFKMESLVIYMLRKMSSACTHCDLCDNEFGGCSRRWAVGYNWIVELFDHKFAHLIGPTALRIWAPQFPYFAEKIRDYIQREHADHDNQVTRGSMLHIGPGELNVFSVTDCTVYEVCRPGSGPANHNDGAGRRQNWYIKQRAFYDGYHRGMEACVKLLTICLPNGMTAAVFGPTSAREGDLTLFCMAEFDNYLQELCEEHHNNTLYATYGDDIFAGYWYCLRTKHKPTADMPLTAIQEEENETMKSVRECVEWSYAKAEQNWAMLNRKDIYKLEQDPERVWAEFRVMYLLTNFKVCEVEGSTMTGTRVFRCPPPTLTEYLAM